MKRLALTLLLLMSFLSLPASQDAAKAQTAEPPVPASVRAVFQKMTPEERIGQLFLVTFTGTDTSNKSQIYDLIANHHVGGVVLSASNDNFLAAPNTVPGAFQLTQGLQQIEWDTTSNPPIDTKTGQPVTHQYVPLFIAMAQDGDGPPGDQILSGLTPLPSEMAIGATWSPDLAKQVGQVMGKELSALGINMYFGPSLDVLESPNPKPGNDPGVGVFGGDPYWVSVLGSAYVSGLHDGSRGKLLVVAKHFPGRGSADRANEQEVATVRKSLDELKQIELAPFFAVTGDATEPDSTVDGLLVSHIRYQGFQGNIRATTKPVSFDAQALAMILGLHEFDTWRQGGGVMVSDNLGTKAVKQFYSTGTDFPARTVARDAFVAGNDLLYLGNLVSSDAPDNYSTVLEILSFFSQKYREDSAFAQRVDSSVLRLLTLKSRLYSSFSLDNVSSPSSGVSAVGKSERVTFDVARQAADLLSPDARDLATVLPNPPQVRDRIIFFTDISQVQQCSSCAAQSVLDVSALPNAITQLYGAQSGNQTSSAFRMSAYTFKDAADLLAGKNPPFLQDDLIPADWVVFSLVDDSDDQVDLISNFLSTEQDLLRNKHVILFAFGAPYYLDATDISRLTAYYALYGKQDAFVQVAARLLFQELTPAGAPPVTVPGLGYDLITMTSPDPNQIIPLSYDLSPAVAQPTNQPLPAATPVPLFKIGDTIALRAGPIKDHNGKAVPDGTVVEFSMNLTGEGSGILQQAEATTTQGIARVSFGLDKPGLLQIHATSDPAENSVELQLDVSDKSSPVTVIVPQLTQTVQPPAAKTPQPAASGFIAPDGRPSFAAWLVTILLILTGTALAFFVGLRMENARWATRWGLCALAGGLFAYNYFAIGLPGSAAFTDDNGISGILILTVFGMLGGWAIGWFWSQRTGRR